MGPSFLEGGPIMYRCCPSVCLSVCPSVRLSVCLSRAYFFLRIVLVTWALTRTENEIPIVKIGKLPVCTQLQRRPHSGRPLNGRTLLFISYHPASECVFFLSYQVAILLPIAFNVSICHHFLQMKCCCGTNGLSLTFLVHCWHIDHIYICINMHIVVCLCLPFVYNNFNTKVLARVHICTKWIFFLQNSNINALCEFVS